MDLSLILTVVYMSLLGTALGSLTGLAPGIHVNALALLLVSTSPMVLPCLAEMAVVAGGDEGDAPLLLVSIIVSAAVAHSFLDVLPSIFLGAAEEDTALSTLPGHRLLLEGKGHEAVGCSAYGALVGGTAAISLCLPLTLVLGPPLHLMPLVEEAAPLLVAAALIALPLSEKGRRTRVLLQVRDATMVDECISLVRAVPVDRQEVALVGKVHRGRCGGRWFVTPHGRWRLRGRSPSGTVRVHGVWQVRRTALRERVTALVLLLTSGMLGLTCMESRLPLSDVWEGMGQSVLFPLLTGLFGMPAVLASLRGSPIPPQDGTGEAPRDLRSGLLGALSGAVVGWFPGISSTTGVIMASSLMRDPDGSSHRYLTMVSAVGTSSTVLGLLALALAFKGRSGAMIAARDVLGPQGAALLAPPSAWFPLLLLAALVSMGASYLLTLHLGRWLSRLAGGTDLRPLNLAVMLLLLALVTLFCGLPGLVVLATSTLLGLAPPRLGVARVHLTGCLLLPTALYLSGLEAALLAVL